jgi:hypothetical protein
VPAAERLTRGDRRRGELKERLEISVELASPGHFIPDLPVCERARAPSRFTTTTSPQALSKIERRRAPDDLELEAMTARGRTEPARLLTHFG